MICRLIIAACFVFFVASIVSAASIDNDYLIGFTWIPPANEWAVDKYLVRWKGYGFGPIADSLETDTNFVAINVFIHLPEIYTVYDVTVTGKNAQGAFGPESPPSDSVYIQITPGQPGQPQWTPDNE